jgi:hypothetical protein
MVAASELRSHSHRSAMSARPSFALKNHLNHRTTGACPAARARVAPPPRRATRQHVGRTCSAAGHCLPPSNSSPARRASRQTRRCRTPATWYTSRRARRARPSRLARCARRAWHARSVRTLGANALRARCARRAQCARCARGRGACTATLALAQPSRAARSASASRETADKEAIRSTCLRPPLSLS